MRWRRFGRLQTTWMQVVREIRNVLYSEINCVKLLKKLKKKIMEKMSKYGPGPEDSTDEGYRKVKEVREARRYQFRVYNPVQDRMEILPPLEAANYVIEANGQARFLEPFPGQFAPQLYYAPNIALENNEGMQWAAAPEREP